ncbi:MAG TPA: aminotransferase class III-fold pyridoxal phosphate-dependent enzyme [Terriglobales bacterium]|nr:aminotransferase class III-fold pyridoxal phosphate-dependent enzyme [Terriglobales bacterium]
MTVAIVQARLGSSRLPGKTLAEIAGQPMLWHVVNRVRKANLVQRVVVATTENSWDDRIAEFCVQAGVSCFRGSEEDVLDRFYQAARASGAEVIVRITADCPLIDPAVVDKVIRRYEEGSFDYVSNTILYTYPDGLDTEVFSFHALECAWREAQKKSEREHVTPYLRTGKFRIANVASEQPVPSRQHRWTVDEPQDLKFIREIYEAMPGLRNMGFREILNVLSERPDVAAIQSPALSNEGYYRSLYGEAEEGRAPNLRLEKSEAWFARTVKVVPGGAQTFSKSASQYVEGVAPMFLERGKGCRVWDVDGNEYIDYVQGLLPNILGYAHDGVNRAVADQIAQGHSFSLPHRLEVELAERLTRLIPCAEMVRFGKNGSDATSGAIRAARAFTGREHIACCGYHGWQDWYIGSTTRNSGVPEAVRALTHAFRYNDVSSLRAVLQEHPGQFAAVIMEPVNFTEPAAGFLEAVKNVTHQHGALLIFDEICSGFHFGLGGAQKRYGVVPDLACFGKAMGNGFPISCIVGRADVMRVFEEIFYSFTFAGEVASMAAAMKVLDILESTDALARMEANGRVLQDGIQTFAMEAGLLGRVSCAGSPSWSLLKFTTAGGADDPVLKNLFQQEAIKRGILVLATHNLTSAHGAADIHRTLEIYAAVIKTLGSWVQDASPARFLEGKMSRPVFRVR